MSNHSCSELSSLIQCSVLKEKRKIKYVDTEQIDCTWRPKCLKTENIWNKVCKTEEIHGNTLRQKDGMLWMSQIERKKDSQTECIKWQHC